jgi:hypothetical protein
LVEVGAMFAGVNFVDSQCSFLVSSVLMTYFSLQHVNLFTVFASKHPFSQDLHLATCRNILYYVGLTFILGERLLAVNRAVND